MSAGDAPPAPSGPRQAYRDALVELARADERVFCIDADTMGLQKTFGAEMPERYINVGIAEATAISIAAGLAASGQIPHFATMATFVTFRAAEQIKVDVVGNDLPAKLIGSHGGFAAGHLGSTHHALEDVAVMRSLPNMTVVVAADGARVERLVPALAQVDGPTYLRIGRDETLELGGNLDRLAVGEALTLREGNDVAIIATGGYPLVFALEAHDALAEQGIRARVIEMHTIAPIDAEAIVDAAASTAGIVAVEDHRVVGGLASAVAEVTATSQPCRVTPVAVPLGERARGRVGSHPELLEAAGVQAEAVVDAARALVHSEQVAAPS
ncbi:MAG: transketolase family protein [Solirubrobacterales bacterium]